MQPQKLFLSNKMRQFPIALLLSIPIALNVAPVYLSARESGVGLEFEGFQELNLATVVSTEYIGDCPGSKRGTVKAHFVSSSTPPALGLRVVLRNATRGLRGDPAPYTNRSYDKGRFSQGINIAPATRHNIKYLAVLPGKNNFEYEIKRGNQVIESGSFTAELDRQTKTFEREATKAYERYCISGKSLNDCNEREIGIREVKHCPTE